MKNGRIVQSGKYEDLIADPNGELVAQMAAHSKSLNQVTPPNKCSSISGKGHHHNNHIEAEVIEEKVEHFSYNGGNLEKSQQEETETGRVKWHVYSTFATCAYRGALVPLIIVCQVLFQALQMASNYWIAWGTEEEGRVSKENLIGIFTLMSCGSSIFILGRAILLSTIAIETSQRLFHGMITSVFRAPLSFFDSTPSSRILNRVSKLTLSHQIHIFPSMLHFALKEYILKFIWFSRYSLPRTKALWTQIYPTD